MPSFLKRSSSTWDRITEEWASQPLSLSSCSMAQPAMGLVTEQMDRAISNSSVWRRGLWLPRCSTFRCCMGSMTPGAMRGSFLSIPARALTALSRQAEEAPRREEVLPVTMRPSLSSSATAGPPVFSAFSRAAATTGRSSGVRPREFMMSSIFLTSLGSEVPRRTPQAAA